MLQPRHRFGLGPEAQALIAVNKVVAQEHLERHDSVKLDVPGTVDDAHTAPADLPEDLVIAHARGRRGITREGAGQRARSIGVNFVIREAIGSVCTSRWQAAHSSRCSPISTSSGSGRSPNRKATSPAGVRHSLRGIRDLSPFVTRDAGAKPAYYSYCFGVTASVGKTACRAEAEMNHRTQPRCRAAPEATSLTLLERLRDNEPEAWRTMVSLYRPLICHWSVRAGVPPRTMSKMLPRRSLGSAAASITKNFVASCRETISRLAARRRAQLHPPLFSPPECAATSERRHRRLSETPPCGRYRGHACGGRLPHRAGRTSTVRALPSWFAARLKNELRQAFWLTTVEAQSPPPTSPHSPGRPPLPPSARPSPRVLRRLKESSSAT